MINLFLDGFVPSISTLASHTKTFEFKMMCLKMFCISWKICATWLTSHFVKIGACWSIAVSELVDLERSFWDTVNLLSFLLLHDIVLVDFAFSDAREELGSRTSSSFRTAEKIASATQYWVLGTTRHMAWLSSWCVWDFWWRKVGKESLSRLESKDCNGDD